MASACLRIRESDIFTLYVFHELQPMAGGFEDVSADLHPKKLSNKAAMRMNRCIRRYIWISSFVSWRSLYSTNLRQK